MDATDPYLTLGIAPSADEAEIRAAYRALMKRFHPDQNDSADAAERARAVGAAYRLLIDPAQRARLDRQRLMREQVIAPPPPPPPRRVPRGRAGGVLLLLVSIGIVGLAVTRLEQPAPPRLAGPAASVSGSDPEIEEKVADVDLPTVAPAQAMPTAPAAPAPPPVAIPPLPAAEAPPPLPAPAPVTPLPKPAPRLARAAAPGFGEGVRSAAPLPVSLAPRPAPAASDECDTAASCARIDLAALDRMQTLLYNQSFLNASAAKQARLLSGRSAFLARLGRCETAACKRDAYLARNREIAELMRS